MVEGNGGQIAIIHDSPVTKTIRKISYRDLLEEVIHFRCVASDTNSFVPEKIFRRSNLCIPAVFHTFFLLEGK